MNSGMAMLRRNVLMAAGASLATSLLEGAAAEAQTQAPAVVSSIGPAISEFNGKLYAAWRNAGPIPDLVRVIRRREVAAAARIPKVASSAGSVPAAFGNKLYAAWKGTNADQRLWYASFDGSKWSPQAQIPGAASSSGPALSVFNGKLYAVWTGSARRRALVRGI